MIPGKTLGQTESAIGNSKQEVDLSNKYNVETLI